MSFKKTIYKKSLAIYKSNVVAILICVSLVFVLVTVVIDTISHFTS